MLIKKYYAYKIFFVIRGMRNKYTKRMRGGELKRNAGTRKLSINVDNLIQYGSSKYENLVSRYSKLERIGTRLQAPPSKPRRVIPTYNLNNRNKSVSNARNQERSLWKTYLNNLNKYEQLLKQEENTNPVDIHHNRFLINNN